MPQYDNVWVRVPIRTTAWRCLVSFLDPELKPVRLIGGLIGILLLVGCASRPVNQPITQVDPTSGYRPNLLIAKQRQDNQLDTLFVVSFSGGGMRAAAFSYGVLEELRETEVVIDGQRHRLIDEVDVITGVSGGSFTALAYALYGDQLFSEYEQRFLKKDVQGGLISRAANPANWHKFIGGSAGRSELAAEFYDEILFEGATYQDLLDRNGPAALVTGTDLSTGSRVGFLQNDFDLICSDLNTLRLSRAAATSSAVPVLLSPVTYNNYGGTCGFQYPAWVADIENPNTPVETTGRVYQRYLEMQSFQNSRDRPYIHVVDGGVSDNLGVRGLLETLEEVALSSAYEGEVGFGNLRRVVLIVVDSHSSPSTDWDRSESPPGMLSQLLQASSVPIDRYSFETVETMKDRAENLEWQRQLHVARARLGGMTQAQAEANIPGTTLQVVNISFRNLKDPEERSYFMNLPTSFVLPPDDIDRIRDVAGRLMRDSSGYITVIRDFNRPVPE